MLKRLGELHNVQRLAVGSGSSVSNVLTGWSVPSHLAPGNPYSKITFASLTLLLEAVALLACYLGDTRDESGSMVALRYERGIA